VSGRDLCQNVKAPTQRQGHRLDLVVIRRDQSVCVLPSTDPLLLSDHSFVVADDRCMPLRRTSIGLRPVRNWRVMNVDAFADDLWRSELATVLPVDVSGAFVCYDETLQTLLDRRAPLERSAFRCALQRAGMTVIVGL
jgi:hypothetical protein